MELVAQHAEPSPWGAGQVRRDSLHEAHAGLGLGRSGRRGAMVC
jgi:hypothetical protein